MMATLKDARIDPSRMQQAVEKVIKVVQRRLPSPNSLVAVIKGWVGALDTGMEVAKVLRNLKEAGKAESIFPSTLYRSDITEIENALLEAAGEELRPALEVAALSKLPLSDMLSGCYMVSTCNGFLKVAKDGTETYFNPEEIVFIRALGRYALGIQTKGGAFSYYGEEVSLGKMSPAEHWAWAREDSRGSRVDPVLTLSAQEPGEDHGDDLPDVPDDFLERSARASGSSTTVSRATDQPNEGAGMIFVTVELNASLIFNIGLCRRSPSSSKSTWTSRSASRRIDGSRALHEGRRPGPGVRVHGHGPLPPRPRRFSVRRHPLSSHC